MLGASPELSGCGPKVGHSVWSRDYAGSSPASLTMKLLGKLANTIFLWLDRHELCPHAIVERILGNNASSRWDWAYSFGLRMCTWIVMRLPEDFKDIKD